jgi:calcineurin-like phosphoesterase family protein
MPITLPPLSRRQFLARSAAAASALALAPLLRGADVIQVDADRFALLSDTHIAADRAKVSRMANMADHLVAAVKEVAALSPRPAAGFINGDLAFGTGESGDYATMLEILQPLREAGLPLHLTMGNHDHRQRFLAAVPAEQVDKSPVADRVACLVESPKANWFVLDSLKATNETPGVVGEEQLKWLSEALDARASKPAIVMVHHNPDLDPTHKALTDTAALLEVLTPRKQVKALLFGHTHAWSVKQQDGLHLVNLPAVAYAFQDGYPIGWVDWRLSDSGAKLELRCVDPAHPQQGEKHELAWRS